MMRRSSDRDAWKMEHWDEYIKGVNFDIPENLRIPDDPESLLLYYNSTDDLADASFARILPMRTKTDFRSLLMQKTDTLYTAYVEVLKEELRPPWAAQTGCHCLCGGSGTAHFKRAAV